MAVGFVYFAYNLDRMKDKELEAKRVREEILRQT
jgi:hypothetical protein